MSAIHDVVVVGGGIFGVTAALELRRRGASVVLLDPGPLPHPDAASTDITKLVRLDYGADAFYTGRMEEALAGWRDWSSRWKRPLFHETGILFLCSGPMDEASFERSSFDSLSARGHRLERLDGRAIGDRFPAWARGRFVDGYYNPQGGFAESGAVVAALAGEARALGVAVREGARIRPLEGDGRVEGVVLDNGDRVSGGAVVIAAGAFTPVLVPELADRIRAIGQPVLHFSPPDLGPFEPPGFVPWTADIGRTGWYGFAAHAGVVKIANHGPGILVDPAAPRRVPDDAEAFFRSFLRDAIPSLADAPCTLKRLCLYCDSFDGDFIIDRHPTRAGLVVAAGGSGHAFKFAPSLGGWIADVTLGAGGAGIFRFRWRTLGDARREEARFTGAS
ncbi:MAG: FAD-dependent oxidoreductase [Polyangiaceae bacterium]|nr:FAD-dependent oxidoreductase [Polyangiaceae bacterium]